METPRVEAQTQKKWGPERVGAPKGGGPEGWRPRRVEPRRGGAEGWAPKGSCPEGWRPKPRKSGAPKGGAPKGGAQKGGAPKGGAPKGGGGPKFRAFFSLSRHNFSASGPPGLHTTTRELQTCTFPGPRRFKHQLKVLKCAQSVKFSSTTLKQCAWECVSVHTSPSNCRFSDYRFEV